VTDKDFILLMKQMLAKNPVNRLYNFEVIKQNSWFTNFDWDNLSQLSMEAPYVPKLNKDDLNDGVNFTEFIKVTKSLI
jgi:hypothetical protein